MAQDATTKPTAERYLEDFVAGQTFSSGRARITAEEIQAFAAKFDPQPFHLSEFGPHRRAMDRARQSEAELDTVPLLAQISTTQAKRLISEVARRCGRRPAGRGMVSAPA